ncbi:MAG: VWA domain-containing protein, partial [Clostridium sp.]|nr:VWA domain-containing protein [Clostridium sp.]
MKIYLKTIGSLIITTVIIITSLLQVMANPVSKSESMEKVDLAFVIDTTGSMGPYINNVKNNISDFATYIENQGIDLRIGIIEYRDITVDGVNSTRVHKLKGSTWHYSTADMIDSL